MLKPPTLIKHSSRQVWDTFEGHCTQTLKIPGVSAFDYWDLEAKAGHDHLDDRMVNLQIDMLQQELEVIIV